MKTKVRDVASQYWRTPSGGVQRITAPHKQRSIADEIKPEPLPKMKFGQSYKLTKGQLLNLDIDHLVVTKTFEADGYQRSPLPRTISKYMTYRELGYVPPAGTVFLNEDSSPELADGQQRTFATIFADSPDITFEVLPLDIQTIEDRRRYFHLSADAQKIDDDDLVLQEPGPLARYLREGVANLAHPWHRILEVDKNLRYKQAKWLLASWSSGTKPITSKGGGTSVFKKEISQQFAGFKPSQGDELATILKMWGEGPNPSAQAINKYGHLLVARGLTNTHAMAATHAALKCVQAPGLPYRKHEGLTRWYKKMDGHDWESADREFAGTKGSNLSVALVQPMLDLWNKNLPTGWPRII